MKYIGYGLLIVLVMSGCARHYRNVPVDVVDTNETNITGTLYTRSSEGKYHIKPEPYSIDSNKTDPELLGPQTTIKREAKVVSEVVTTVESPKAVEIQPTTTASTSSMTKEQCIAMIGNEKFERYSKRFGGESGAIKRCAILKRLKRK